MVSPNPHRSPCSLGRTRVTGALPSWSTPTPAARRSPSSSSEEEKVVAADRQRSRSSRSSRRSHSSQTKSSAPCRPLSCFATMQRPWRRSRRHRHRHRRPCHLRSRRRRAPAGATATSWPGQPSAAGARVAVAPRASSPRRRPSRHLRCRQRLPRQHLRLLLLRLHRRRRHVPFPSRRRHHCPLLVKHGARATSWPGNSSATGARAAAAIPASLRPHRLRCPHPNRCFRRHRPRILRPRLLPCHPAFCHQCPHYRHRRHHFRLPRG